MNFRLSFLNARRKRLGTPHEKAFPVFPRVELRDLLPGVYWPELARGSQQAVSDENSEQTSVSGSRPPLSGIPTALVIAIVAAVGSLFGSGVTALLNSKTERQKSSDQIRIEQGKSQTQLDLEKRQSEAQIELQKRQSEAQLKTEQLKVEGTLQLEKEKQDATAKLARQEFETKLIMQAVQGVPSEVATKNLQYFLHAGFISDPDGKISRLSAAAPPSIPSPNSFGIPLKNPKACTELEAQDFKGAATPMTQKDIQEVAASMDVEVPALLAVIDAETPGHGFVNGRPTLLFERSIFHRLTKGTFDTSNPEVSSSSANYLGGEREYERLKQAMILDCGAALAATTWGLSGLTGANYQFAGFTTVDEFISNQMVSERVQLESLARFLKKSGLVETLRKKDWKEFARGYNGPVADRNGYPQRLADAYQKHQSAK